MERLILIDGHAILHRAYHALPPLTNSQGELVNAVFGFLSMLLKTVYDLKPTHLAVVFDRPTPTFRQKLYVDYQAKRPKMDDNLAVQIGKVHEVLVALGIPIFEIDGYEADDVIGTIAEAASSRMDVYIVTGDRDLLQLVNERIKAYMPVKGLSEAKLYGEKEVEEKFGVSPSQVVDYKALVGDSSDNYSGVPGIGPKTASNLLHTYRSLSDLYNNLDKISNETVKKRLSENAEKAELSRKLATIERKVPIEFNILKCTVPDLSAPAAISVLQQFEFKSLAARLTPDNSKHVTNNKRKKDKSQDGQIKLF